MNQLEKCDYWWEWLKEDELIPLWIMARSTCIYEWYKHDIFPVKAIGERPDWLYNKKEVKDFICTTDKWIPAPAVKVRAFFNYVELQPVIDRLRMIDDALKIRSRNEEPKYERLVQVSRHLAGFL